MAKDFNIFVVHGFKSNCDYMKSTNGYLLNNKALSNNINGSGFNWSAGPEESNLNLVLNFLTNRPESLRLLKNQWAGALSNIPYTAEELSSYVCETLDKSDNKHIVFVGHSLGAEVIRKAIPLILGRRNAIIDLFIMAGVSNRFDYKEILHMGNVRFLANIYSTSDMVLKVARTNFIEHGGIYDPMGLSEIEDNKVMNIEVSIDHDDYNDSREIEHYFKLIIDNLLKSPKIEKGFR